MVVGGAVGVVHIVAEHAPVYAGAQSSSPVKISLHVELGMSKHEARHMKIASCMCERIFQQTPHTFLNWPGH